MESDVSRTLKASVYCFTVYRVVNAREFTAVCIFKNPASLRLMATFPISGNWMSGITRIMLVYQLILKNCSAFCAD